MKRIILVMVIFAGTLFAQRLHGDSTQPATKLASTTKASTRPAIVPAIITTPPKPKWLEKKGKSGRKYLLGSLDVESGYLFQVELISDGAAINTVKLGKYFSTVTEKRWAQSDSQAHREALQKHPGEGHGHYSMMNPVSFDSKRYLPLATRRITIIFADGTKLNWNLHKLPWCLEKPTPPATTGPVETQSLSFFWILYRHDTVAKKPRPVLKLTKTYTVRKDDYTIDIDMRVENLSSQPVKISLDQSGPTGLPREDHRSDMRKAFYGKLLSEEKKVQALSKTREKVEDLTLGKQVSLGSSSAQDPVLWIGQTNKFFGAMMYLVPTVKDRLQAPAWNADFYIEDALESATSGVHVTGIKIPDLKIEPGDNKEIRLELFAGPKQRGMFVDSDAPYFRERYEQLDYISTIDLRGCFCAWDWLSMGMIRLLKLISRVTFGNYGVAIIVLVILVRLVLHPLTKRSQISMSGMKKLGPMMKELQKKYADNKEVLKREQIKMYKEHGFTPMLGCLPMLLQMPILIALWTGINASIDLRHAAFLPVWIIDLAAPDALFSWGRDLPLIGRSFNLIPLLLGGAMYWQMKLNPNTNQPGATPEQQKQQKMMTLMMPLMMPIMFYNMASGLTLYFMVSTFFGAAEQQIIRKHIEAKEAAAAAVETTIKLPGKGPRGSRPKKSKGPFYTKRG